MKVSTFRREKQIKMKNREPHSWINISIFKKKMYYYYSYHLYRTLRNNFKFHDLQL